MSTTEDEISTTAFMSISSTGTTALPETAPIVGVWDYVVFALLLGISGLVGPFYMWRDRRRHQTAEGYFMGNRSLKVIPTAASLFASFISAAAMIGLPTELYTGGAKFFMHTVGSAIGCIISAFVVVPVFYRLKLISSLEYLERRYHSKLLRKIASGFGIFAMVFFTAVVTYAPCHALEGVSGIPKFISIFVTAGITMFYTVLGGMKAVVMVDLIQAAVMFGSLISVIIVGFYNIPGGVSRVFEVAYEGGRLDFFDFNPDPRNTYSIYAMMIPSMLGSTLLYATSQPAVQRFSALESAKKATMAVVTIAPLLVFIKFLLLIMSITMYAYYNDYKGCDPLRGKLIDHPNQLTTRYVTELVQFPGFIGLWFAGLFSGSLSTMSTTYNSMGAMLWEDFLKEPLEKRLTPFRISILMKSVTFMLAMLSCSLSFLFQFFEGSVTQLMAGTGAIAGSGFVISYIAGCFIPFVNAQGAFAGVIAGTVTAILLGMGQILGRKVTGVDNVRINWLPTNTAQCPNSTIAGAMSILANSSMPFTSTAATLVNETSLNSTVTAAFAVPEAVKFFIQISPFQFSLIALTIGLIFCCLVSCCSNGIREAAYVDSNCLVVKNCFAKSDGSNTQSSYIEGSPDSAECEEMVPLRKEILPDDQGLDLTERWTQSTELYVFNPEAKDAT